MNPIVEARRRKSMTQKRLAHEAGIAARTLRKVERGEEVSLETMRAVRRVLKMDPVPAAVSRTPDGPPLPEKAPRGKDGYVVGPWWKSGTKGHMVMNMCVFAFGIVFWLSVIGLNSYFIYELSTYNTTVDFTVQEDCGPSAESGLTARIEQTLEGSSVRHVYPHPSAEGCKYTVQMDVVETGDSVVERLRETGLAFEIIGRH